MLHPGRPTDATERSNGHGIAIPSGHDNPLNVIGVRPDLVGAALSYDSPARLGERLPDVLIFLWHRYRSYD
jgi:hypothetical protein